MSNEYFGVSRQFIAKDVHNGAISPPSDFTIPIPAAGGFATTIVDIDQNSLDPDSNVIISRVGLFSNFADGLVKKTACDRLLVGFTARSFSGDSPDDDLTGTMNITACSKAVVGVGASFDTELADGNYFAAGSYVFKVNGAPGGANAMNIHWWPPQSLAGTTGTKLTQIGTQTFRRVEITELNMFVPVNEFLMPSTTGFSSVAATRMVLEAEFLNSTALDYLTKSISTAYDQDICHFDLIVELLYTKR